MVSTEQLSSLRVWRLSSRHAYAEKRRTSKSRLPADKNVRASVKIKPLQPQITRMTRITCGSAGILPAYGKPEP
jgi:hypothetical protein